MHPPGLEPGTTVPKTVVISISPRVLSSAGNCAIKLRFLLGRHTLTSAMDMLPKYTIPEYVGIVSDTLQNAGYEAYLVGGCVRDVIRNTKPNDWDITTNATPEQIQEIFEHTYYENTFGTVGVVIDDPENPEGGPLGEVEVTPYRLESTYSDNRHPDEVRFSQKLEDDLQRRDFRMNAMAISLPTGTRDISKGSLVDPYGGIIDIENNSIQTVGDPALRFGEDALRMMRAVRFSAQLGFVVARQTGEAIQQLAESLNNIARERIRDEFQKIIMSDNPKMALELAHDLTLLQYIVPELEEGIGIDQNQAHSFDVWEHLLRAVQATADKGWELELRLASLFHDIGKPRTRAMDTKKNDWSFHGHEVVGAKMTRSILRELKFPKQIERDVTNLVRWHMFFSDPDQISLSAVRRMIRNVGEDRIWDLMNLRIADRIGTGRPKEQPYRFRKYKSMIEEVMRDPVSTKQLAIDGSDIMKLTGEKPGPRIGWTMHALLEDVLDDPTQNTIETLQKRSIELSKLDDKQLRDLGERGLEKKNEADALEIETLRRKHHVK